MRRVVSSATGRGFDREVANWFINRGFVAVKSSGSKTICDVAAFPMTLLGPAYVVQCKAGEGRVTVHEWNGLLALAQSSGGCVVPLAAVRVGTEPVFYQLLAPLQPRTRKENLPWEPYSPA